MAAPRITIDDLPRPRDGRTGAHPLPIDVRLKHSREHRTAKLPAPDLPAWPRGVRAR